VLFHALAKFFDVFDLETIVIHAGLNAGVSWQHGQADDTVADVTPIGILLAGFIHRARGHALHSENGLVKIADSAVIVSVHGDVSDFGKHKTLLVKDPRA
jgi:hypothetical protein